MFRSGLSALSLFVALGGTGCTLFTDFELPKRDGAGLQTDASSPRDAATDVGDVSSDDASVFDAPPLASFDAGHFVDVGQDVLTFPDAGSAQDSGALADAGTTPDASLVPDEGTELNVGWIGGACESPVDCALSGAECLSTGFPNGYCTTACLGTPERRYCRDATLTADTLYTVTRCVADAEGDATCASECDFTKSVTGCRPEYRCFMRRRFDSADTLVPVCLPAATRGWPGDAPIGAPTAGVCDAATDCIGLSCLPLDGGYCSQAMCDTAGCPAGERCIDADATGQSFCMKNCDSDADCAERQQCSDSVCVPAVEDVAHDASFGESDCASVWERMSPCDTSPYMYVVIRKSSRNAALCRSGELVANHAIELGMVPVGDRQSALDGRTPEGTYYVTERSAVTDVSLRIGLSYPSKVDASRAFASGLLSAAEFDAVALAEATCTLPPQTTALGGSLAIGNDLDPRWGSIRASDEAMLALFLPLRDHDTVVILP